ncbi:unnamed protein product [Closterium sp. Naga37s-1]|nr:unnamed protein product [Closterium sp. Naga37s-1]
MIVTFTTARMTPLSSTPVPQFKKVKVGNRRLDRTMCRIPTSPLPSTPLSLAHPRIFSLSPSLAPLCILPTPTPLLPLHPLTHQFKKVKFKKVKVDNRRLGSYFVPNYNLTTPLHPSPPFLQKLKKTTNHKTAVYTMNPKWATLLPYTDAIVFNAGHWFFHPPKDQTTPWYPIPVMSKALVTVRDYFAKANYKGAAVFFTFSPVHDKGYCNAAQPFPPNVKAELHPPSHEETGDSNEAVNHESGRNHLHERHAP